MGACASPDLTGPCPVPPNASPADIMAAKAACYGGMGQTTVDTRLHKDVDILFLIDNSPSMSPKQKVLAQAIPGFIQKIEATNANYHVGIVTSDLGFNVPNGTATGQQFPGQVLANCNSAAGDDGVLQNIPCTNRTGLSGEAASACSTLCPDPRFVPNGGARYISKQDGVTNVPSMMMNGSDVGPQLAFQCMALVGDIGCGVEQQLESVKRALDNHRPENTGFNRGTSVLAVIFITDEDDCSVQLSKRSLLNPATPMEGTAACTTPTPTPGVNSSCFNVDYRCIATDVTCTEPMNTTGKKTNCTERADSIMNSIDQYVNFFSGLPNPNIILAGIWTPTMLDNVLSDPKKDGQLYIDNVNQGSGTARLNRGQSNTMINEAACYTPDPGNMLSMSPFFGQAQIRLSSFIRRFQAKNISEHSICDALSTSPMGGYTKALDVIANNIASSFGADCLAGVPKTVNGKAECVVGYVDAAQPAATPDNLLPQCSDKCCNYFATDSNPKAANDPNLNPNPHLAAEMAACGSDPDCFCAVPSTVNCAGTAVAGVWRAGNAAPPSGKVVDFRCAINVAGP
jgi:hypothetical protein